MASSSEQQLIAEFAVLNLKPGLAIEKGDERWRDFMGSIGAVAGTRQFFGRQIENPDAGVHVIFWPSLAEAESFRSSPAYKTFTTTVLDEITTTGAGGAAPRQLVILLPPPHADSASATAAIDAVFKHAPVTEVFTGYGAEEGFLDNVVRFGRLVDEEKTAGYRGGIAGVSVRDDVAKAVGSEVVGSAVKLVIGWDSREVHLEAKGRPGVIRDEIHLMRVLRKEIEMYHVPFEEL